MLNFNFQGSLQRKIYFEGWYYKNVTFDKNITVSIIPGISLNREEQHAFIQIIENKNNKSYYVKFPITSFSFHEKNACVQIDDNYFYPDYIDLSIDTKEISLTGFLYYSELTPLPTTKFSPSIMGPFAYLPKLECHHEIISMHHYIDGILTLNGEPIDFEDGIGYLEKDYGSSFPKSYTWFQSNHLVKEDLDYKKVCLFFSIAEVPLYFSSIKGFIASILINDREYRFATYNGSKVVKINKKGHIIKYIFKKRNKKLIILIKEKHSLPLTSPNLGMMKDTVYESIDTDCQVTLYHKKQIIFQQKMTACGYEKKETVQK